MSTSGGHLERALHVLLPLHHRKVVPLHRRGDARRGLVQHGPRRRVQRRLRERLHAEHADARHHRRLAEILGGDDCGADALREAHRDEREHTGAVAQPPIER